MVKNLRVINRISLGHKAIKLRLPQPLIVGFLAFGFLFLTANTAFGAYFLNRVYPGVSVAGMNLSGLTREQAHQKLQDKVDQYQLTVSLEGKDYQLKPSQLGASYDVDATLDIALSAGKGHWLALQGLLDSRRTAPIKYAYAVDQTQLSQFVSSLSTAHSSAPVDATVVVVNGQPQIQADKNGLGIDQNHLALQLQTALGNQGSTVSLQPEPIPATIKAADVTTNVTAAQRLMATHLELDYADKVFVPTAADIGGWLSFNRSGDKLTTVIDPAKLTFYVQDVAAKIYVAPKNHLINTENGQVTNEEQGVEGLAVNQTSLTDQIMAAMGAGVAAKLTIPTAAVPFKTVYNNHISLDFGRYIEINLSQQHLWVYQDHNMIFESPLTSGATGAGYPTVEGLFSIQAKERNRNLNGYAIGYNYNVYVQYWMPFYGNYGLHDASWRSSFGGQDYYYGGSHGCVNLPLDTAAWLYNWGDVGTPVWIHS